MENPFRYGDVATGAYFTNRTAELAELEGDIRSGQNVVIISPRRYGKTSLVHSAIERLRQEGVLIAYLDLFRCSNKELLADHLAGAIYKGLIAIPGQVAHQATKLFESLPLQPKVTLNLDGSMSFEFVAAERSRDLDKVIEGLLTLPGKVAKERRRRVALILDEFQEIVQIDSTLPARMRAIFQVQQEVSHVFLGSKRHLMQRVFTDINEPMYKLAKPLPLLPIQAADFTHFIRERFESTGGYVTDEAITRILEITECHPHDTQELCYFTWAIAQAENTLATPDLVARGLKRVLAAEDARYTTLWERLTTNQRLLLQALITSGSDGVYSEAYRRQNHLGASSTVHRSMSQLIADDLVESTPLGRFIVPDVFLRAWVKALIAS